MEKRTIDHWIWGPSTNSVRAVQIKNVQSTLYCSGLVALCTEGQPSAAGKGEQFIQTTENLEQLLKEAGYKGSDIVRLNTFTTSTMELFTSCADL